MPVYPQSRKWSSSQQSRRPLTPIPDRLPCQLIAEINAALNTGETTDEARQRFAKVADRVDEVDRAIAIFEMWRNVTGGAK